MDHYRLAARGARDGLWDWDLVSNRVHYSPRWISALGYDDGEIGNSPEEWLGRIHPDDGPRVRSEVDAQLAGGASEFDIYHRLRQRDGTYRRLTCHGAVVRSEDGRAVRLVGSLTDAGASHVADPVTGLPNRDVFLDHLAHCVQRATGNPDALFAVLLVDLDRCGGEDAAQHATRDTLLTTTARRLETCLRVGDGSGPGGDYLVARLRGTQFALLLDGLDHVGRSQAAADRVLASVQVPIEQRGRQLFPRACIGMAVSATGYTRAEDVMRDADAALHRARLLGGNRCEVFDISLVQSADARLTLEADLAQALDREEFLLHYQPVLDATSNRIAGFEALTRWQHPTRGLVPPDEFIPIAEKTGFILRLGEWTLREACRQRRAWQESLPIANDVWVSVNLSSAQFQQGLVEHVEEALRETGLAPACLMLELTESLLVENPVMVRSLLMQLRVMGVKIGIDDFGTGHSSFAYLHQFPADFLKIDQSFVRGMDVSQHKADIVGTIAGLAGQLGLSVIAEGIENEATLALMRSHRCQYVQGFFVSRPVDAGAIADLLRAQASAPVSVAAPGIRSEAPTAVRASRTRRPRLLVGVAALGVLLLTGATVRLTRGLTVSPPLPSSPLTAAAHVPPAPGSIAPGTLAIAPTPTPVGEPESPPAGSAVRAPAGQKPAPQDGATADSSGASDPAPAATTELRSSEHTRAVTLASPLEVSVKHQHVFGSCSGRLTVSSSGLSYASDNEKDAFTLEHGHFESVPGDDGMTIKADGKTYRFKAASKDGVVPLREARKVLDGFRTR